MEEKGKTGLKEDEMSYKQIFPNKIMNLQTPETQVKATNTY